MLNLPPNLELDKVKALTAAFGVPPRETDMLLIDTINMDTIPAQAQAVLVAAPATNVNSSKLYGTVGVCAPVSNATGKFEPFVADVSADSVFELKNFPLREQDPAKFADLMRTSVIETFVPAF